MDNKNTKYILIILGVTAGIVFFVMNKKKIIETGVSVGKKVIETGGEVMKAVKGVTQEMINAVHNFVSPNPKIKFTNACKMLPKKGYKTIYALQQRTLKLMEKFGKTPEEAKKNFTTLDFLGHKIFVNKLVYDNFKNVRDELIKTGWDKKYKIYRAETFNFREVSNYENCGVISHGHPYCFAIDINPEKNPLSNKLITDIPKEVVAIFKKHGFVWGGDWKQIKDPMHFEIPLEKVI